MNNLDKIQFTFYNPEYFSTSNVLLISGQSRAGKTTLAKKLSDQISYSRITLDRFANLIKFNEIHDGDMSEYNDAYKFISERNITRFPVENGSDRLIDDFILSLVKESYDSGRKIIIEGFQLIEHWRDLRSYNFYRESSIYHNLPMIYIHIDKTLYVKRLLQTKINYEINPGYVTLTEEEYIVGKMRDFNTHNNESYKFFRFIDSENIKYIYGNDLHQYLNMII